MPQISPTAIVTGGGTGVGAAVCRTLARRGFAVAINYARSRAEAEALAAELTSEGAAALAVQGDVAQDADCRRIVMEATAALGPVSLLVNNAGVTLYRDHADLEAIEATDFRRIYDVNVIGAFQMIRACRPHLAAAGGAVVNVSSTAGLRGTGSSSAYAASKGALNTLTLSMARALAPRIRVNAVCPGFIDSGWFDDLVGADAATQLAQRAQARTPLDRVATPDDVADAIAFLGSREAKHLTGVLLPVEGGILL